MPNKSTPITAISQQIEKTSPIGRYAQKITRLCLPNAIIEPLRKPVLNIQIAPDNT